MLHRAALFALTLAFFGTFLPGEARADTRVAVVDVQHAVMQTEDGIRAQAQLKKMFDKKQHDLDARQDELQRMKEDIEKQSRFLSRDAVQKRMEDWQKRMVELQTVFVENNKELQKTQSEKTAPILKKMMAILARIGKKNGYDVIIDRQAAPYVRSDLDLTDQVIQMYNSGDAGDAPAAAEEKKPENK